jgi:hypothetical protein
MTSWAIWSSTYFVYRIKKNWLCQKLVIRRKQSQIWPAQKLFNTFASACTLPRNHIVTVDLSPQHKKFFDNICYKLETEWKCNFPHSVPRVWGKAQVWFWRMFMQRLGACLS